MGEGSRRTDEIIESEQRSAELAVVLHDYPDFRTDTPIDEFCSVSDFKPFRSDWLVCIHPTGGLGRPWL